MSKRSSVDNTASSLRTSPKEDGPLDSSASPFTVGGPSWAALRKFVESLDDEAKNVVRELLGQAGTARGINPFASPEERQKRVNNLLGLMNTMPDITTYIEPFIEKYKPEKVVRENVKKIDFGNPPAGNVCPVTTATTKCQACVNMCNNVPCWGTAKEMRAIMDAGLGDRLGAYSWDLEPTDSPSDNISVTIIAPATIGKEGENIYWRGGRCTFLTQDDKCELHDLGLKPLEGRLASCVAGIDAPFDFRDQLAWNWVSEGNGFAEAWRNR